MLFVDEARIKKNTNGCVSIFDVSTPQATFDRALIRIELHAFFFFAAAILLADFSRMDSVTLKATDNRMTFGSDIERLPFIDNVANQ